MLAASFSGVLCPICQVADTKVIDSRAADGGVAIRRRRECTECERRFNTFERIEEAPVVVIKRGGLREPFEGGKIVRGLVAASKGRPLSVEHFDALICDVEDEARLSGGDVTSEWVGLAVLDRLRHLDEVAYLRFASVYKSFTDIADFEREARLIKLESDKPAHQVT
ncbi:MAG: transcriptional regulator NrdR [Acidimicrobiales bacterium]